MLAASAGEGGEWQRMIKLRPQCAETEASSAGTAWSQPVCWSDTVVRRPAFAPWARVGWTADPEELRTQVHELWRQREVQEDQLADVRSTCFELRHRCEEEKALRAARQAKEAADGAARHEEELGRVVERYERQIKELLEPRTKSSYSFANSSNSSPRSSPARRDKAPRDAAAADHMISQAADAMSAQAEFYKQKLSKLRGRLEKRMSGLRAKLRVQGSALTRPLGIVFLRFALSAWVTEVKRAIGERAWRKQVRQRTAAVAQARQQRQIQEVLSAWTAAATLARHQRELSCKSTEADAIASAAIARLRTEVQGLRARRRLQAMALIDLRLRACISPAFHGWVAATAAAKCAKALLVTRTQKRNHAVSAIQAFSSLSVAAVLRAWFAAAAAAKSEKVLSHELDTVSSASTAALHSVRTEFRSLRQRRRDRALITLALQAQAQLRLAFVLWTAEVQGLQGRRHLEHALEDADLRHVRALAVQRTQAREARVAMSRAGAKLARARIHATCKAAFQAWKGLMCLVQHESRSQGQFERFQATLKFAERHVFAHVAFLAWRVVLVQLRSAGLKAAAANAEAAKRSATAAAAASGLCRRHRCLRLLQTMSAWQRAAVASARKKQMTQVGEWLKAAEKRHEAALADAKSQGRALAEAVGEQGRLQVDRLFSALKAPRRWRPLIMAFEAWHWTAIRWDPEAQ